jgi:hypothetical protein
MARERQDQQGQSEQEHTGSNGDVSGELIQRYLDQIDQADDELITLKVEHMSACKGPRSRIRECLKEARDSGVNMAALRAIIAKHRTERKVEQRIAELEEDEQSAYQSMQEALGAFGDTELGKAALNNAGKKRGRKAAAKDSNLDDLHA